MLRHETIQKIESFVYTQPRSIDEIAKLIDKNWRTADRYIQEIEKEYGSLAVKVFRPGSRGAIKIVFWNSPEKASKSVFQETLENEISKGKVKEDFSAFDIYQFVDANKKSVKVLENNEEYSDNYFDIIKGAKKQLLIFSGNLSFSNIKKMKDILGDAIKRGVEIKIICRVDIAGFHNVESILNLNTQHGKELITIRHYNHPLRGIIADKKIAMLKEIKEPTGKSHELAKRTFFYYTIKDLNWIEWLSRIFWKIFSSSIDAHKRIEELRKIR